MRTTKTSTTPGSSDAVWPLVSPKLKNGRNARGVVFVHSLLDDYGLTPPQFRVYGHLARRADNINGNAWPTIDLIAYACKLHPQTVRNVIKFLVQSKLIVREPRPGTTPFYRLTPASQWEPSRWMPVPSKSGADAPCEADAPVSDSEATHTKQMQDHPCVTNGAKGNPIEGNPRKNNTHTMGGVVDLPMSEAEAVETAKLFAIPEDFARNEFSGRAAVGWVNGAGLPIKSWPNYLKKRWADEQRQRAERATRPGGGRTMPKSPPALLRQFTATNYRQSTEQF